MLRRKRGVGLCKGGGRNQGTFADRVARRMIGHKLLKASKITAIFKLGLA